VTLSADGTGAISACDDGLARLWNPLDVNPTVRIVAKHGGAITAMRCAATGDTLLTGCSDGTARVWDVRTGSARSPVFRHIGPIFAVDFHPTRDMVFTAGGSAVCCWDVRSGTRYGATITHPGPILAARLRPDGQTVLTGGENNTAQLWSVETGEALGLPMIHQGSAIAVAFGPRGRTILTGGHDRTARLWDEESGIPLGPSFLHPDRVSAVAFGPPGHDNIVATGCADGRVRIWDVPATEPGSVEQLRRKMETTTGLMLERTADFNAVVRSLDDRRLRAQRERLARPAQAGD
jgi:WD40 repeat protein